MPEAFRKPLHRQVLAVLRQLDRKFLSQCGCFFGGGTRIVMELGEYRESRDIDFLCADRTGYRRIRESVDGSSLGCVAKKGLSLAREVRADQYGVRSWIAAEQGGIKFEILREARIELAGETVAGIPLDCLSRASAFAEKLLANADRGLDRATLSRDLVDLAFMIEGWDEASARAGRDTAVEAYGADVARKLEAALALWAGDRAHRTRCVESLAVEDTKTLAKGIKGLARFGAA